jgi:hypothetical protein
MFILANSDIKLTKRRQSNPSNDGNRIDDRFDYPLPEILTVMAVCTKANVEIISSKYDENDRRDSCGVFKRENSMTPRSRKITVQSNKWPNENNWFVI